MMGSYVRYQQAHTPLFDYYVQLRYNWFRRFRETDLDRMDSHTEFGFGLLDVFFPRENSKTPAEISKIDHNEKKYKIIEK